MVIVMVMVMSYGSDGSGGGVVEQLAYHAKLMFDIG